MRGLLRILFFDELMVRPFRAVDVILTGLTLYKCLHYKAVGSASPFIDAFIKHGLFYFVAISSLHMINVIFFLYA